MADSAITSTKNITSTRKVVEAGDIGKVHIPAENTHFLENKAKQMFSKAEGVGGNLGLVDSAASPNAFKNQINEVLEKYNWDVETFQKTKQKPIDKLSETELSIMKEVRDAVPRPTSDTVLQKTIPVQDIEKYISGDYTEIGGYVAKVDDVGHIKKIW